MGARGGLIMNMFGALFVALTMYWQWHVTGPPLVLPFLISAPIGLAALYVLRLPGTGIRPSARAARAILWSTIGEGLGLFLVANIAVNLRRLDLLLPFMALVVGLHFLPIARAAGFRPFLILGVALILAALLGLGIGGQTGGVLAGLGAAMALWVAAALAVSRDLRAKRAEPGQ